MMSSNWKTDGWHINGNSWRCPTCGSILGANLKDERPFLNVGRHQIECRRLQQIIFDREQAAYEDKHK